VQGRCSSCACSALRFSSIAAAFTSMRKSNWGIELVAETASMSWTQRVEDEPAYSAASCAPEVTFAMQAVITCVRFVIASTASWLMVIRLCGCTERFMMCLTRATGYLRGTLPFACASAFAFAI